MAERRIREIEAMAAVLGSERERPSCVARSDWEKVAWRKLSANALDAAHEAGEDYEDELERAYEAEIEGASTEGAQDA